MWFGKVLYGSKWTQAYSVIKIYSVPCGNILLKNGRHWRAAALRTHNVADSCILIKLPFPAVCKNDVNLRGWQAREASVATAALPSAANLTRLRESVFKVFL